MNRYFHGDSPGLELPRRVFARSIDFESRAYEIFDAVDADWLERRALRTPGLLEPAIYGREVQEAPIYTVEVHAEPLREDGQETFEEPWAFAADAWLADREARPDWQELTLAPDPKGPALVFDAAEGAGRRARIEARGVAPALAHALSRATDLSRFAAPDDEIEGALPAGDLAGVVVLDVGQGGATAIVGTDGRVVAYFDLGAGITRDAGTWPRAMHHFCLESSPPIVLSHWHQDHFHGANKYMAAQQETWIAPVQRVGPGPQTAMANAIAAQGRLMTWAGSGALRRGRLRLERCSGPATNMNRCGLALWIDPPDAPDGLAPTDPILLPADAGYADVPGLAAGRSVHSFVVAHHGGTAPGRPPGRPGAANPRAAYSFGPGNSYGHPLQRMQVGLRTSGWATRHPGPAADDPRTEDRRRGLGHIGLDWGAGRLTVACGCNATVHPIQY